MTQPEKSTWLANFFTEQRKLIELAETPAQKWAVFTLPIIAPIVPASLTGFHLYQLFLEIFTFSWDSGASSLLSIIIAVVLELLGYVGAVNFIKSFFKYVSTRDNVYLLPTYLDGSAYVFYLVCMFLINVALGVHYKTPGIVTLIVGLLSSITIPTSLLAGTHLNEKAQEEKLIETREREEKAEKARMAREDALLAAQHKREDDIRKSKEELRLRKWAMKNGLQFQNTYESTSPAPANFPNTYETKEKTGRPSIYETKVFAFLDGVYKTQSRVASFSEVQAGVDGISSSAASKHRTAWVDSMKKSGKLQ